MSFQTGSVDADGLARTSDGKLYVTIAGASGSTSPAGAAGFATLLAQSFVPASCPSDVTEDVLATIAVPANLLGANGSLQITTYWTYTNSANSKTPRVRYSGAGGAQYLSTTLTTTASTVVVTTIGNRGATNSQVGSTAVGGAAVTGLGTAATAFVTSAVDTTAATSIVISGQKALNTETLTLEGYTVMVAR